MKFLALLTSFLFLSIIVKSQALTFVHNDTTANGVLTQSLTFLLPPMDNENGQVFYLSPQSKSVAKLTLLKDTVIDQIQGTIALFPNDKRKYLILISPDLQRAVLTFKGDSKPRFFELDNYIYKASTYNVSIPNEQKQRRKGLTLQDVRTAASILSLFL